MKTLSPDLSNKVEKALESIRPYLEEDGGDVCIKGITSDKILKIELLGNCQTCPMSSMTLKAGVEEAIRRAVPEIRAVEAINIIPVEVA